MRAKKFKALAIEIAEQMVEDRGIVTDKRTLENLGIAVAEYIKPDIRFDNSYAVAEGWDLFNVGPNDGDLQIQRCDDSDDPFNSDAEAIAFVQALARAGSKYHADALSRAGIQSQPTPSADVAERWVLVLLQRGQRRYWSEPLPSVRTHKFGWGRFADATLYVEAADAHTEAQRIMREARDYTMQIRVCTESGERQSRSV